MEKKGKVGIIEGSQGTDPQIYRTQTFLEYLSSYPDVEVVGIEEANWSRAKSRSGSIQTSFPESEYQCILLP